MHDLPDVNEALVVRTDFSDEAAWISVCREIETPVEGFQAAVRFVSDPAFEGRSNDDLLAAGSRGPYRSFLFIVDAETLQVPEHPILVLDLESEPGRTFRVIPREMWGVENNLSIANMDFSEFADSVDPDGVFRGFPEV